MIGTERISDEPLRMNLQLFADANETGEDEAEAPDAQAGAGEVRMYTAEEMQAEIDRVTRQRLSRERRDAERRIEAAREEARSEAEKLARMTVEQRMEHERSRAEQSAREREAAIAQREADVTRRELRATAIDTLAQKRLPRVLEAVLNYTDAEACNASIDAVEKAFREAVQEGVNERMRASSVPLRSGGNNDMSRMSDADYYAATYRPGEK